MSALVLAASEDLDQVVVGDQRARHADGVAVAALDRLADHRRGLESAGADHRHVHRRLDRARVRQVLALDLVRRAGGLVPPAARQQARAPWNSRKLANVRSPLEIIVS